MKYTVLIEESEEGFAVSVPGLPGCHSQGATEAEALANITDGNLATGSYGLRPSDILFDPLTFTICTGNEEDRRLGLETLDAVERIRGEFPQCQVLLGLSNISFGLKPPARRVLNSVYLQEALKRGLTAAGG